MAVFSKVLLLSFVLGGFFQCDMEQRTPTSSLYPVGVERRVHKG